MPFDYCDIVVEVSEASGHKVAGQQRINTGFARNGSDNAALVTVGAQAAISGTRAAIRSRNSTIAGPSGLSFYVRIS